jgi:hypothetical protein
MFKVLTDTDSLNACIRIQEAHPRYVYIQISDKKLYSIG